MKKLILIMLLTIFFGLNLFAQKNPEKLRICITEQEYEVYTAVGVLNYQNETITEQLSSNVITQFPDISPETVADFNEKNSKPYLLRCLNKKDRKEKKLPKSYAGSSDNGFSRIGFSSDGKEALVYHSWASVGNNCGSEFVLLRKQGDIWETINRVTTVIC